MRRFLRHLLSFCALPGLLLLLGETVLRGSGEVWPLDRVFAHQRAHSDSIYLRAIDQPFYAYKYRGILENNPSILVAGSSRTMKFRAAMFGERAGSFYNAGGLLNSLRDIGDFCQTLPRSRTPAVLLLGIDLWWLNDHVVPLFDFRTEIRKGAEWSFDEHIIGLRWLLMHPAILAGEAVSLIRGNDNVAIGISARRKGGGFRPDGSFKSAVPTPRSEQEWTFVDRETPPVVARVKDAVANFPPTNRVSPERLALLESVLSAYRAKHVLVIGYLPPFSSEVAAHLAADPRHSSFWSDFRQSVPDVFRRHGFPVIDASEAPAVGMDDRALSDGFHAEETFHVRVLKALLRDSRVRALLPGADVALERALTSPKTNYWEADLGS